MSEKFWHTPRTQRGQGGEMGLAVKNKTAKKSSRFVQTSPKSFSPKKINLA